MNKIFKIIVSILGGINTAFSIIIPIFIALLIIQVTNLSSVNQWIVIIVGSLATVYRGLSVWIR